MMRQDIQKRRSSAFGAGRFRILVLMLALLGGMFAHFQANAQEGTPKAAYDLLSWPRMRADAFGCFLETEFGHRDAYFNCSLKDYQNHGDPCKKPKEYYEGPAFPESRVSRVHELIESIQVSYEHGEVQSVWVTLKKPVSRNTIIRMFDLPNPLDMNRPNVTSVDIVKCSILPDVMFKCLNITGFQPTSQSEAACKASP